MRRNRRRASTSDAGPTSHFHEPRPRRRSARTSARLVPVGPLDGLDIDLLNAAAAEPVDAVERPQSEREDDGYDDGHDQYRQDPSGIASDSSDVVGDAAISVDVHAQNRTTTRR